MPRSSRRVDTGGVAGQVAFELGDATAGLRCTAVQPLAAVAGPQPVTAKLRSEKPGTTVHFRLVVTTAAGQVVGADQVFTTVANATRLAPGTTMLGIRVGYLTPAQARARVLARFARPVVFTWHGKRWKATPKQLGATADVDGALDRALAGVGGGRDGPGHDHRRPGQGGALRRLPRQPLRAAGAGRQRHAGRPQGRARRAAHGPRGAEAADGDDHHAHAQERHAPADRAAR